MFGCVRIDERIEDLEYGISELPPVLFSLFDDCLQIIFSMISETKADPSRARAILTEVERALKKKKSIGVVISNEVYGAALEKFLSRSLETDPLALRNKEVHIVNVSSLRNIVPPNLFDVMVYHSYRGGNIIRWIMSGKSKEAVVIATRYEKRAMERDIEDGTGGVDTWRPNRKSPYLIIDENPEEKLIDAIGRQAPSLPAIPFDDELFVQGLHDYNPLRTPDVAKDKGPVKCVKVNFQEHYAYLPVERLVTLVTKNGTRESKVKNLKRGSVVVFINQSQSRSIYDVMLDEIKRSTRFEQYVSVIQQWHRTLKSWFSSNSLTFSEVHQKIKRRGSNVVEGTVSSWLRGNVMAPLDHQNLSRLLDVVGISDKNGSVVKAINDAAIKLRKVSRVYAKTVNAFLIKAASDNQPEVDDLLRKYNLDIVAIRESVLQETVAEVSKDIISLSPSVAGRLYGL